ncbi:MAG TPA: hypothetical protein VHC20_05645 [Candidatus Paceibacterota bacterium]|nr:hypothetical protein [Candidatus Paceibacterota bacterium]
MAQVYGKSSTTWKKNFVSEVEPIDCEPTASIRPMKHFTVSISNRKSTGESDTSSTKTFIVSVRHESELDAALAKSVDEILKLKSLGLFLPVAWRHSAIEIGGNIGELGKPLISTGDFEVRRGKP